jgi:hypothetical protein
MSVEVPEIVVPFVGKRRLKGNTVAAFSTPIEEVGIERLGVMAHLIIQTARNNQRILTVLREQPKPNAPPRVYVADSQSLDRIKRAERGSEARFGDYSSGLQKILYADQFQVGTISHPELLPYASQDYVSGKHVGISRPLGITGRVIIENMSTFLLCRDIIIVANWGEAFSLPQYYNRSDGPVIEPIELPNLRAN